MLTLTVIGVEDGALIAANDSGERFRIPIDAQLRARLRDAPTGTGAPRLSPREIQAHVRSGLTAAQVSTLTGAPISYIERFVGPVLAEREYIVDAARGVRVKTDEGGPRLRTFGAVMTERLSALAAGGTVWSSWKEPDGGWIVALSFSADDIEHQARWNFDPKRSSLTPDNVEAATLSQQGDLTAALSPRLRAVSDTASTGAAEAPETTEDVASVAAEPEARREPEPEPAETVSDVLSVSHEHSSVMEHVDTAAQTALPSNVIGGRFGTARQPVNEPGPVEIAESTDVQSAVDDESSQKPAPARFDSAAFDLARGLLDAERDEAERLEAERIAAELKAESAKRFALPRGGERADKEPPTTTGLLTSLAAKRGEREPTNPNETAAMPADFDGFDFDDDDAIDDEDEDPFLPREAPEREVPAQITRGRFPDALPEPVAREPLQPLKRPRRGGTRSAAAEAADEARAADEASAEEAESGDDVAVTKELAPAPVPNRPVAVPPPAPEPSPTTRPRRGRTTMPSWDEIVYGRDE